MQKQTKADKLADRRTERAFYARCSGVQINVMDMGKVFAAGRAALAANPAATDGELGDAVRCHSGRDRRVNPAHDGP